MLTLRGLCLLALLACPNARSDDAAIRVGFAYAPPYSQVENRKCAGSYCEIAKQIFTADLGLKIEAVQHPWARIQREVELGQIDIMFALPSEQRDTYAVVSEEPVFRSAMKVFTYSGHPRLDEIKLIETIDDIENLNLVSITNQGNGWHAQNVESLDISTVHAISDEHTLKMLAAKRGDIVIDAAPAMRYMMEKMKLGDNIIETDIVLDEAEIHIVMSRDSQFASLMPRINQIIEDNYSPSKATAKSVRDE